MQQNEKRTFTVVGLRYFPALSGPVSPTSLASPIVASASGYNRSISRLRWMLRGVQSDNRQCWRFAPLVLTSPREKDESTPTRLTSSNCTAPANRLSRPSPARAPSPPSIAPPPTLPRSSPAGRIRPGRCSDRTPPTTTVRPPTPPGGGGGGRLRRRHRRRRASPRRRRRREPPPSGGVGGGKRRRTPSRRGRERDGDDGGVASVADVSECSETNDEMRGVSNVVFG